MGLLNGLLSGYRFVVYRDHAKQFRFRFVAANGRIMADSGEGYTTKQACLDAINTIKNNAAITPIDDQT